MENNDLISRSALKKAISEKLGVYIDGTFNNRLLFGIIDNAPTAFDVKGAELAYNNGYKHAKEDYKRPKGEWNEIQAGIFCCPFCGARPHKDFKNFCAKCGAKMISESEDK